MRLTKKCIHVCTASWIQLSFGYPLERQIPFEMLHCKKKSVLIFCCAFLTLSLSGCSLLPQEEVFDTTPVISEQAEHEYETGVVTRGDVTRYSRTTLYFRHAKETTLSFEVTGVRYEGIYVKKGDSVEEGQLIASLEMGDIETQIADCENEAGRLRLQIDQTKALYALRLRNAPEDQTALTEARDNALQSLNDALEAKNIHLTALKRRQSERQITAPFSGTVISAKTVYNNTYSVSGEAVCVLADPDSSVFVPETNEALPVEIDSVYTVTNNNRGYEVYCAEDETDHSTVFYPVDLEAASKLRNDAVCTLKLQTGAKSNVLRVRTSALFEYDGSYCVFVKDENGLKAYRTVEIGLMADDYTEILSGLEEGEEVILE